MDPRKTLDIVFSCSVSHRYVITQQFFFTANLTGKIAVMTPFHECAMMYDWLLNYNPNAHFSLCKIGYNHQTKSQN